MKKITCIAICSFCAFGLYSQNIKTKSKIVYNISVDSSNYIINVNFYCDSIVNSLLVFVSDQRSNVLFLDNQHFFQGPYNRPINMNKAGPGIYFLNISNDKERIIQQIKFK